MEKKRVNRNGFFMELSDQEHDDVVDNDRRKKSRCECSDRAGQ